MDCPEQCLSFSQRKLPALGKFVIMTEKFCSYSQTETYLHV